MIEMSEKPLNRVIDVVCGMTVVIESAAGYSTAGEITYYFCSLPCKDRFDLDPGKYLNHSSDQSAAVGRSSCCQSTV